ncbi:uncharacterized protein LOC108436656 isoform X1 [Pygocentrus nattereri]|uniref:uncharacterized protein LOC108436656 isoform X1 n=2 Tax=Pygocentrus nattereri TaxID=42514 RepID=UPI001890F110|nr:uncharacterized protein LOC108436656 isoform X1 [Pygocentrus nattereri]
MDTRTRLVKRQVEMFEQQFWEFSSTHQHDSSTHRASQSVRRQSHLLEQQSWEFSSSLQHDSSTHRASQSVKRQDHLLEQQSWEFSSTLQHDSSTHQATQQLQIQLEKYTMETLTYIKTVKDFCNKEPEWTFQRELEIKNMKEIKSRADKGSGRSRKQKLAQELGEVLRNTLEGLQNLQRFLDAVEKLAVTSLFVFIDEIFLPKGVSAEAVRSVISVARKMSPLLIHFKRDDGAFFLPSFDNLDVLVFQLHKYMRTTQWLCKNLSKITFQMLSIQQKPSLKFTVDMRESLSNMTVLLDQLSKIRMDESFRLTYLFDEGAQEFIETYSECRPRMFQFLSDLEETAVQLDKMKKGSSISTVAGSSVGAVGSVLSIVGLALAPVTAGVSLGLTITGVGLGVTSGVNGLVTGFTEHKVNKQQRKKANNIFHNFMEDVQKVLDSLEQAASSQRPVSHLDDCDMAYGRKTHAGKVEKNIKNLLDGVTRVTLKSEGLTRNAARSISTPLAITKAARVASIAANVLFIGIDIALICKESASLAKGGKSEASQFIRSRSALWCAEIRSWEKIWNSLCKEQIIFKEKLRILEQKFYVN